MRPSTFKANKALLVALLSLAATQALAGPFDPVFLGPAQAMVAQMSPEERRALRDRWEQASPEERLKMRREFRERLSRNRSQSGDGRDDFARDMAQGGRESGDRDRSRYQRDDDDGRFGTGFERRRGDGGRYENPAAGNVPAPEDFFDRRHGGGRDRNRP